MPVCPVAYFPVNRVQVTIRTFYNTRIPRNLEMIRYGQLFLLYFLSTAGLVISIFLLGDATLFYEGMTIVGVILITNIMVIAMQAHR